MAKARFDQHLMSTKRKRKGFNHSDEEFSIYLHYTNFYDEPRFKFMSFPLKKEGLDQFDPTRLRGTVVGWLEEFLSGGEFELDDPDAIINKVLVGLEDLIEVGDTSLALDVGVVVRLNREPEDESGDPDEDVDFEVDPDEALDEELEYESMCPDEDLDEEAGTQEDEPEYTNVAFDEEAGLQEDEPEFTDEYFNDEPEPEPEPESEPEYQSIYLEEALHDEPGYYIDEDMEVQEYDPMYLDEGLHEPMETEDEEEDEDDEEEDEEVTKARFQLVKEILMDKGACFQKASSVTVPLHGSSCAICLEEFEGNLEESVVVLLCSHVLHEGCLIPSILKSNRTCPLCRHEVLDPDLLF